jgi:predicted extracellular nuclease
VGGFRQLTSASAVFAVLAVFLVFAPGASTVSTSLVINEVDYDQPSTDTAEFLELKNVGASAIDLDSYAVQLVNGTGGGASIYQTIDLPSVMLPPGDHYVVCGNAANTANCDLDVLPDSNLIQNGDPDAIGLLESGVLIDALSYEGNSGSPYTEGSGAGADTGTAIAEGLSRCPDGADSDQNSADFLLRASTPGALNSCPPAPVPLQIAEIQGAGHVSPHANELVLTGGIVTAKLANGFYLQDPTPDSNDATSDAIFVFTGAAPTVNVGDDVGVRGNVSEFRPGGSSSTNLSTTELTGPMVTVVSTGNALPAAVVLGEGGRVPPSTVIEDDAMGSVETSGVFDPAFDGIDFYEALEAMRVQVNDAVAVGPRNGFGEIPVIGDDGAHAGVRTTRGGVVISADDFNPERIHLDDTIRATPVVNVGDGFASAVGVLDYSFGNFKLNVTDPLTRIDGQLEREVTRPPTDREIAVATYNVENLDPADGAPAFARHADYIVNHLLSPDLVAIEEIQDNDGPGNQANSTVTDASTTWGMLIDAIEDVGGPTYSYRQIDPVDDQDGGEPGGNIRVGFLFRSDRELDFIDRPGGTSTSETTVIAHPSGPQLSFSPGRVDPQDPAFANSRKPLAGEFRMRGEKVFVVVNHFASKGGDDPLFGRFQPPQRSSEMQRHAQAQAVNDFVDSILAVDPRATVIVLGDINDFEFSQTVEILEGGVLSSLMDGLPKSERYSYVFEGNSQVLDQILVSNTLLGRVPIDYDVVHVNSEFADQASDHDPQVARIRFSGRRRG